MDSEPFQVIIRIRKSCDLSFTTIARPGIQLPYVQRPAQQAKYLLLCHLRGRRDCIYFGAPLKVKMPDQLALRTAAAGNTLCNRDARLIHAASTSDAFAIIEPQKLAVLLLYQRECAGRASTARKLSRLSGKQGWIDLRHAAAFRLPQKLIHWHQAVGRAQ